MKKFDDEYEESPARRSKKREAPQEPSPTANLACWCGIRHETGERLSPMSSPLTPFPETRQQPAQDSVFVSALPFSVSRDDIPQLLSRMIKGSGLICRNIYVLPDANNKTRHTGQAIVTMYGTSDAGIAIDTLNGHEFFGLNGNRMMMRADFARPRPMSITTRRAP